MAKITKKIIEQVKGKSNQPTITLSDYQIFAEDIIADRNETINKNLGAIILDANALASALNNNAKMSESYFNSRKDVMVASACEIDFQYDLENTMFEHLREILTGVLERETLNDLHLRVDKKHFEHNKAIDTAMLDCEESFKEYMQRFGLGQNK